MSGKQGIFGYWDHAATLGSKHTRYTDTHVGKEQEQQTLAQ